MLRGSSEGMASAEAQGRQEGQLLVLAVAPGCGGRLRAQGWDMSDLLTLLVRWKESSLSLLSLSLLYTCAAVETSAQALIRVPEVTLYDSDSCLGLGRSLPVAKVPSLDFSGSLARAPAA